MACGCNFDAGTGGPLLMGTLDPAFASPASTQQPGSVFDQGVMTGSGFSLAGILVAGVLVALLLGGAWLLDKTKKDHE